MENKITGLLVFATILVACVAGGVHGSITCEDALAALQPCRPFLTSAEPKPPTSCCGGVATVTQRAASVEDRKAVCECFKKAGPALGVKQEKAKVLPQICGVKVGVPIDPNTDCSK